MKRSIFIEYGKVCHNFKNLQNTLIKVASIHQSATWRMSVYPRDKLKYTGHSIIQVENTIDKNELLDLGLQGCLNVLKVKTVQVFGNQY